MSIFADIRTIADHQVLAYMVNNNDEIALQIMFHINGGTCVSVKMSFDEDPDRMKAAFTGFCNGEHDDMLANQIASCERDFIAVDDEP